MNLYEFLTIIILVALFVVFEIWNRRWINDLLNRIMSVNYQEYKYYQDKWPNDVKTVKKMQETEIEEVETEKKDDEPGLGEMEDFSAETGEDNL